jgi:hypothetical protein
MNPIAWLWGAMHGNVTPDKYDSTCGPFAAATLGFLGGKFPRDWANFRHSVTANFRVISPKDFRVLT